MYNLTVKPFADISLDLNLSLITKPISLSINPYYSLLNFIMPISFEIKNSTYYCANSFFLLSTAAVGAYFSAKELEGKADILISPFNFIS